MGIGGYEDENGESQAQVRVVWSQVEEEGQEDGLVGADDVGGPEHGKWAEEGGEWGMKCAMCNGRFACGRGGLAMRDGRLLWWLEGIREAVGVINLCGGEKIGAHA